MRNLVAVLVLLFAIEGAAFAKKTECPDPPCGGVKEEPSETRER
jgi:hypothetical protein